MSAAATAAASAARPGGKYLTFAVGDGEYGVAVRRVREILGFQALTRGLRAATVSPGTFTVHGEVLPVVDLRTRFGMPPVDAGGQADARQAARAAALRCIIVVEAASDLGPGVFQAGRIATGIVVDRVTDVAVIAAEVIEAPTAASGVRTDFLLGRATDGTHV
ncbi:MAG: chemotaxis protein CheW, partial [Candidatus Eremiobacteraeota bacterium]|nr:chemotaxis protein CheW [Candidatus Eremiobacteraeota bacterium]